MSEENTTDKLMKLNGSIIKSDGSHVKSDFFKFLEINLDDYSDIEYTPEEAQKIRSHMSHLSTGATAVLPLKCAGPVRCPFAARCPFVKIDKERKKKDPNAKQMTPVTKDCLVEINLLNEWTRLYVMEFDVPEKSFLELMMCRELAEIEVMLWRLNNNLSKEGNANLVDNVVMGVDKEGNPLMRLEKSAFLAAKEQLTNRKSKIIKAMVGDRQEKYKKEAALKIREEKDPSVSSAKLRGEINRLLKQAESKVLALKESEGDVIDITMDQMDKEKTVTPESIIDEVSEE